MSRRQEHGKDRPSYRRLNRWTLASANAGIGVAFEGRSHERQVISWYDEKAATSYTAPGRWRVSPAELVDYGRLWRISPVELAEYGGFLLLSWRISRFALPW